MTKLKVLDLFSGIGGFSLGLERTGGFETVAFCEIEEFPQKVLRKHWPNVPIFEDVRTIDATGLGRIDCVTGGYPCQPFSTAGKRRGHEDDRHLWPAMFAVIKAARPTWVIGENVAGHISMGLDTVLSDLESEGYTCRPFVIPACALDAPHRRDRVWVVANCNKGRFGETEEVCSRRNAADSCRKSLANTNDKRQPQPQGSFQNKRRRAVHSSETLAHSEQFRCNEMEQSIPRGTSRKRATNQIEYSGFPRGWQRWCAEPSVGRVAHGIPQRVDRLKSLGNAVVPQIPEIIGRAILKAEGLVS